MLVSFCIIPSRNNLTEKLLILVHYFQGRQLMVAQPCELGQKFMAGRACVEAVHMFMVDGTHREGDWKKQVKLYLYKPSPSDLLPLAGLCFLMFPECSKIA